MGEDSFVEERLLKKVPRWRNYLAAKLGFRNHWYPVMFSREIGENEVEARKLLGENILLKRIDGKVHAIRDRCLHRGVKLSEKVAKLVPNGDTLSKAWFIDPAIVAANVANWTRRWQREVAR